jgi:hypothetical protein
MVRYELADEGIILHVRVQPNSSKTECVGEYNGMLKIKVASPPVDNAANKVLLATLAGAFGVSKNKLQLISGQQSKQKRVLIKGLSEKNIQEYLSNWC